jgi:hypothetical protein
MSSEDTISFVCTLLLLGLGAVVFATVSIIVLDLMEQYETKTKTKSRDATLVESKD